jgi:hypothetical protein
MTMPSAEGKAGLARAKAVEGDLEDLAEHHGLACAAQCLFEGALALLIGWIH